MNAPPTHPFQVWVTQWVELLTGIRSPGVGCLRMKTLNFMLDRMSGWSLWASLLGMSGEGVPQGLEALGQTLHLELWTVGSVEPWVDLLSQRGQVQ